MAMTKKEQQAFDAMETEMRKARALRFPDYAPEWIAAVEAGFAKQEGWTFNVHCGRVDHGWFTSTAHGYEWPPTEGRSGAQNRGGPWYRSEVGALMALRIALTHKYAEELAKLDKKIEGVER